MRWLQRLLTRPHATRMPLDPSLLPMGQWQLVARKACAAIWRDPSGDVISLTLAPEQLTSIALSDTASLHTYCRGVAESQSAGLVEVGTTIGAEGQCLTYIYKRLDRPAFTFFGVAVIPIPTGTWIWMIVAYERGVTGVREALVGANLMQTGKLTLESYETSWAQDPYDPSYRGVDHSTLRYLSDDVKYDIGFPDHPLTKVRREVQRLITVRLSPSTAA